MSLRDQQRDRLRLLVSGFVRDQRLDTTLPILTLPEPLITTIYRYHFCVETWNSRHSHSQIRISDDGQCAELSNSKFASAYFLYGERIVSADDSSFTWHVEIAQGSACNVVIGLVPDDAALLQYDGSSFFGFLDGGSSYAWAASHGLFAFADCVVRDYSSKCRIDANDVLSMKLDLKASTLHFIHNGHDFGDGLSGTGHKIKVCPRAKGYRFVACVLEEAQGVKLAISGCRYI